jgi:hypothetical protein
MRYFIIIDGLYVFSPQNNSITSYTITETGVVYCFNFYTKEAFVKRLEQEERAINDYNEQNKKNPLEKPKRRELTESEANDFAAFADNLMNGGKMQKVETFEKEIDNFRKKHNIKLPISLTGYEY